MKKILLIVIILLLGSVYIIQAQYILRAPTQRFSRPSQRGNILYVANSILNTGGAGQNTAPPELPGAGNNNNGFTTNYIDIDGDASTYSSSSAQLNLASCSEVLFAGLYWGAGRGGVGGAAPANSTNDTAWITAAPNAANTVRFRLPGGAYTNITATVFDRFNQARVRVGVPGASVSHSGYMCFADVTTMVRGLANPNGNYFLANMVGPVAAGKAAGYGGWTMVIVYSDPTLQVRNLTVFDGCVVVTPAAGNVDVNVSGFNTPPTGPVSCQLGAVVIDGDRNDGNDAYLFSQTGGPPFLDLTPTTLAPGNSTSRLNDTWNSTISYNGAVVPTRNPAFNNTYGYDADIFEIPNPLNVNLGNSRTSATVRFTTSVETYHLQVITTSISNFNPTYTFEKTATDINGGAFLPGDSILYKIRYSNLGNDSSTNTIIIDNLPTGTAFVPGSIKIGTTARTDATGDDQAEYDFSNNRINFRLGVGATIASGGRVGPGVVDSVEFKVVSPSSCTIVGCVGSLRNSARINYGGKLSGGVFYDSSGVRNAGCLVLGPVIMPISGVCSNPRDTILVNRCTSATVLLPYGRYAGYTFYSAMPFIPANIYNQYLPVTATGIYWAYYSNGLGCSDTARIFVVITNCPDIDDDNDGIPDYVEFDSSLALMGGALQNWNNPAYPGYVDHNLDLVNDRFDWGADADNDRIPNFYDTDFWITFSDANNDGINDKADKDRDGIPNQYDLDSDNDGIPDTAESYGVDTNGNGLIDNYSDTDNDGFSQNVDGSSGGVNGSGNGLGPQDLDRDSIPNYLDLDSDNDGIPDLIEALGPDANHDAKIDAFADANLDGIADNYINASALLITGVDLLAPFGRADDWPNKNKDMDMRPNAYDLDSDGDGITDVIEGGLPDANMNGIVDGAVFGGIGNGWSPTVSAMPALNLRNTDGIGNFDYLDIDSDEDGIPDNIEGISTASYAIPTLTDADGDGLMLPYDNQPAVFGGTGITPYDHDGDNTPDYRDLDTDADGLADRVEGNDYNLNGLPDDLVIPTGLDADGDGLDNRYDSLNSPSNIKGTSSRMGNSGSFTGDATPGSRTTVQRTMLPPFQIDRDWRFSGFVLPVQFVKLSGQLQANHKLPLSWTIIATTPVDHFEVERSTDNRNFIKVGTVSQTVNLNVQQTFSFTDDVAGINKDVISYRIKVTGKAGEIQYSNILVIRKQQTQPMLSIVPNPATDYVSIGFYAAQASDITIRMIDEEGKTVLLKNEKAGRGSNTIRLAGLAKYGGGTYTLQLFMNDKVITQKLVLLH